MHGPAAQKVVLAHGCFDVLHIGHKRHLEEARSLGDRLVVSITSDELVNKGPGRPIFTATERKEMLLALDCVDDVIVCDGPTAKASIEQIKPAVYVKGIDYENSTNPHHADDIKAVEALGGRVHITRTAKWSSSRIVNAERLDGDAVAYLDRVRGRGWLVDIRRAFDRADALNVLFVGETIIDEYRYVQALAKPSKEFILATVEAREPESFLGGVVAASLHAEWKNTKVCTVAQPIKKTRYVDADFGRKLFEVYSKQRIELSGPEGEAFQIKVIDGVRDADVIVVLDFGHGLIGKAERTILERAKFLAVNAQTNAGNHGFNPVSKYWQPHLVCVDEPEMRLATGTQYGPDNQPLWMLAQYLSGHIGCRKIIMTRGRNGAIYYDQDASGGAIPVFGTRAVDTMGAGDAFLAVTAPLVAAGLDLEAAAFVGNVAGAIKTDIVGHRRHVGRQEIIQTVEALLA